MIGSADEGFEGFEGPGKSGLRGALAEMITLYVIRATEKVMIRVKKKFPHPISLPISLYLAGLGRGNQSRLLVLGVGSASERQRGGAVG